ncbi:MAG TPA: 5-formyltetrahydrofolate cyclo-ligase [Candidatus Macondimonas sp.]|nr:5-formyltetrahydrofolate cyclo-ligase [Candidatus Macondimonas sp.]
MRARLRKQRRDLSTALHRQLDRRILARLGSLPVWRAARTVALYLPADGEVDPRALIMLADRLGKTIVLPRLHRQKPFRMDFVVYRPGRALQRNRFGIPEPCGPVVRAPVCIDLVILPLVGFDRRGNRLGMGSGYYDRRFAFVRRRAGLRPKLIGLAYEFQCVPALDAQPWDVPLHGVVTERGWRRARPCVEDSP